MIKLDVFLGKDDFIVMPFLTILDFWNLVDIRASVHEELNGRNLAAFEISFSSSLPSFFCSFFLFFFFSFDLQTDLVSYEALVSAFSMDSVQFQREHLDGQQMELQEDWCQTRGGL